MTTAALVLAAGRGERLGADLPKAFVKLAGVPLVLRSLRALEAVPEIDVIVPVVAASDRAQYEALSVEGLSKLSEPVSGGAHRQESMARGLAALPLSTKWVAVHDAARCLVDPEDVRAVLRAAVDEGAAILATRVSDTIKRVRAGRIVETPLREECFAAQTPQVFGFELLREALAKATAEDRQGTDDAQLVEALGVAVRVVASRSPNPKITHAEDLAWAEGWLKAKGG